MYKKLKKGILLRDTSDDKRKKNLRKDIHQHQL